MKNDKTVSVVIPIYNAEKYIEKTLGSVINQTYKNLEIILVNDGSTDNSLNICQKIKDVDNRIQIINQSNKGVSEARNAGKMIATGEYIIFIDSDDILLDNMIETLVKNIEEHNADISICGYKEVFENGEVKKNRILGQELIMNREKALKVLFSGKSFGISLWDKLIRKNIIDSIEFEKGRTINEDKYFLFKAIENSNKIYLKNEGLYLYMQRSQTLSKQKFGKRNLDILYFSKKMEDEIKKEYPDLIDSAIENRIMDNIYVYRNIIRSYSYKDDIYIRNIRDIENYLKNNYNHRKTDQKYNKKELWLICKHNSIYKILLKLFDKTIRNWRKN